MASGYCLSCRVWYRELELTIWVTRQWVVQAALSKLQLVRSVLSSVFLRLLQIGEKISTKMTAKPSSWCMRPWNCGWIWWAVAEKELNHLGWRVVCLFLLWNKHTLEGLYMFWGKEVRETLVLLLGLEPWVGQDAWIRESLLCFIRMKSKGLVSFVDVPSPLNVFAAHSTTTCFWGLAALSSQ